MSRKPRPFDKYDYYKRAVQSPEADCQFMARAYRKLRGRTARLLREDFCGTFAVCCEWVRRHADNRAVGIDLDDEPIGYGKAHNLTRLSPKRQKAIKLVQDSVLTASTEKVDIIAALNFSFFIFKSRMLLRRYFVNARKNLKSSGLLMVDCFGGKDVQEANVECTRLRGFKYYWDQTGYDPVTHEAVFHIHFKRKGEAVRKKVFTYDWRVWTIPEIREIMMEAGFKRTHVFWEGTTRTGDGDGNFQPVEKGEECDGWIAYVIGEV